MFNPLFERVADASLAAALITVSLLILIGVGWRTKSGRRMRLSAIAFASGLLAVAASLLFPQLMAGLNDGPQEMAVKLIASVLLAGAGFLIWPLLRLGTQRRGFISGLTDANLLRQERDDLANAKTTLEKRIVHRSYELERANRQMRLALLGSAITVFRQDKNLRYVWIFNQPPQTLETDFIGKTDDEVFPPDVAMAIAEVKRGAMETGEEQSGEVRVRFPHGVFWYLLRSQPDYDENGALIGTISCAVDITEQKRQQQRQELLMREVTHRSKNLLAVLQGIVRQTARRTKDLDEFISSFSARLQSIAHSHDLLVNDNWSGTSLRALIERQIGIFSDLDTGRIRIDGADISITAVAVQNLGLAFHELATNALKYGSLSMPEGLVQVGWQIDTASKREQEAASGGELRLIWQETGGPIVKQLGETGFGRVLLEQVVGRALDGIVTLDFAPSGVICTMRLPLSRAAALEALPQTADIAPVTEKA